MVVNPFTGTTNITFGAYDSNHTSNVAFHYSEGHLITPWPLLLLSLGTSVVLGYIGYHDAVKAEREWNLPAHNQGRTPWLSIAGLVYSSLRLIFLLVTVSRGTSTGLPSPTAILLFFFSFIPYTWNHNLVLPLRVVAFVESLTVFGTMLALFFRTTTKLSDGSYFLDGFHYGTLVVTGGNCPFTISSNKSTCQDMKNHITYSGCNNWTDASVPIVTEPIGITEIVFELLFITLIGFAVLIYIGVFFSWVWEQRDWAEILKGRRGTWEADRWDGDWLVTAAWVSFIISLLLTLIVVPEHVVQEIGYFNIYVLDSFGPFVLGNDSMSNGSSWTDCFLLKSPSDGMGFFAFWWQTDTRKILRLLSTL